MLVCWGPVRCKSPLIMCLYVMWYLRLNHSWPRARLYLMCVQASPSIDDARTVKVNAIRVPLNSAVSRDIASKSMDHPVSARLPFCATPCDVQMQFL